MATNRFGHSDDFVLKNKKVGINTSEPQEELEVVGDIKSHNLRVTGDSSLTTFEGFLSSNQNVDETLNVSTSTSSSLSDEIIIGDGVTATIEDGVTSSQGNIDSLKVFNTFTIPTGGTEDRPSKVKPGQLYYNVDFKTIEFWDGNVWRQVDNTTQRGRGVFGGGTIDTPTPGESRRMDYINIMTLGNSISFGDLTGTARRQSTGCSSSTRGLFMGGQGPGPNISDIDYITIASEGNSQDFGNLQSSKQTAGGLSSSTRGISYGHGDVASNQIDYVEIATLGNALDFGDAKTARRDCGTFASSTRGINGGGISDPAVLSEIEFITIASQGNGISFGDLTKSRRSLGGCSNSTRGVFFGGGPTRVNTIDYITIASTGNAIYFGDLTSNRGGGNSGSTSTQIRGIFAGGDTPTYSNIIDYITITTTGNAQDFGDLSANYWIQSGSLSDSHGGLGGF